MRACVRVRACACVCVCVCVCVCATHGGLSDTSALEIRSRGGSGFNSLPVRSPDFEKRWAIPLSAYVEVDSSLFVSERICGVRCRKLRHYSIPFLLSLSAYSELTAIKTFTDINLAQSFAQVQTLCLLISIGSPSWFKTEVFPTLRHNQLPRPLYRKHTEPWHHCVVSNRTVNFVNRYTLILLAWNATELVNYTYIYIYIYIYTYDKKWANKIVYVT